jgi:hypothetical protein
MSLPVSPLLFGLLNPLEMIPENLESCPLRLATVAGFHAHNPFVSLPGKALCDLEHIKLRNLQFYFGLTSCFKLLTLRPKNKYAVGVRFVAAGMGGYRERIGES